VDVDSLIAHTELGALIARSATGVANEVLDEIRSSAVGLDDFAQRWTNRLLRRDTTAFPVGPAFLVAGTQSPSDNGAAPAIQTNGRAPQ
jgi:hypothetical protein